MIAILEHITSDSDQKYWQHIGPFLDFTYSYKKGEFGFKDFHIIKDEGHYYPLRLYKLDELKKGFVCNDLDEAKALCAYIEKPEDIFGILKTYPSVEAYCQEHTKWSFLGNIGLSADTFLANFANHSSLINCFDFDEFLKLKGLSKFQAKRLDRF